MSTAIAADTSLPLFTTTPNVLTIALAMGDGIGPEIMEAVLSIFNAEAVPLQFLPVHMGKSVYEQGYSSGMTDEARAVVEETGLLFKGPMETPKGAGVKSINVTARKVWNTFANKRVFRTLPGVETVFSKAGININLRLVRENIEDTYGGIEHMYTPDVAVCRRFITRPGSEQVHRYAFHLAERSGAKRITCCHKANIMKLTDGIFLEEFYKVAAEYPHLKADDKIVDDLAMQLVTKPQDFDVIVLPNLQGDILSDLCAGLVGGLGFAPSANIGHHISIFEAVHGTAPDIAGKGVANPTSLLLSGMMLLRHVGLERSARRIEDALLLTLQQGHFTRDIAPNASQAKNTLQYTQHIIENLEFVPAYSELPNTITFSHPLRPVQNPRLQQQVTTSEIVGVDVFIECNDSPNVLGPRLQNAIRPGQFQITMVSNRGTQVWPTGSVFTECVDQVRVRFESVNHQPVLQEEVLDLAREVAHHYRLCSIEMLLRIDGKPAFSKAQGQ
jgi:isocitrate dehydrogenase